MIQNILLRNQTATAQVPLLSAHLCTFILHHKLWSRSSLRQTFILLAQSFQICYLANIWLSLVHPAFMKFQLQHYRLYFKHLTRPVQITFYVIYGMITQINLGVSSETNLVQVTEKNKYFKNIAKICSGNPTKVNLYLGNDKVSPLFCFMKN